LNCAIYAVSASGFFQKLGEKPGDALDRAARVLWPIVAVWEAKCV
jgi:hypothetical protein